MVPKRHRPGRTGSVSTNSHSCRAAHRRRSRPPPRERVRRRAAGPRRPRARRGRSGTTPTRDAHGAQRRPVASHNGATPRSPFPRVAAPPRESVQNGARMSRSGLRGVCKNMTFTRTETFGLARRFVRTRRKAPRGGLLPGDDGETAADDERAGAALGGRVEGPPGPCRPRGRRPPAAPWPAGRRSRSAPTGAAGGRRRPGRNRSSPASPATASVTLEREPTRARAPPASVSWMSTISDRALGGEAPWNTTTSSSRFRNSGLKCRAPRPSPRRASPRSSSNGFAICPARPGSR